MNKITKLLAAGLLFAPVIASAQTTYVTTATTKRVAVVEEFTGNYCTFCPSGHKIMQDITDKYPGQVIPLKIQHGDFAGGDPVVGGNLSTPDGNAIAAVHENGGWPNMKVNRDGSNQVGADANAWENAVTAVIGQDSPVNIYADAVVDVANGQIDVTVEYYYTSDEANSTNYLHVGIYQENIAAYQYNSNTYYSEKVYIPEVELYEFDHCFRENLNGTWGQMISATTTGSTDLLTMNDLSFTSSFNNFDVHGGALKVFAYISSTQQGKILTGVNANMSYTNFPNDENVSVVYATSESNENCQGQAGSYGPRVVVSNLGDDDLSTLGFDYSINGTPSTYSWGGTLGRNENTVMTLPDASFTWSTNNVLNITAKDPNGKTDADVSDNSEASNWGAGNTGEANRIRIDAKVDQYGGSESTWKLYDGSGAEIANSGKISNNSTESVEVALPNGVDCYTLELIDTYGDGWGNNNWAKIYDITDGANKFLKKLDAEDIGFGFTGAIEITNNTVKLSVDENIISNLAIYPNPTNGNANVEFNVNTSENVTVNVINTLGQTVSNYNLGLVSGAQNVNINGANLENGIYFVNINIGGKTATHKLTVSK